MDQASSGNALSAAADGFVPWFVPFVIGRPQPRSRSPRSLWAEWAPGAKHGRSSGYRPRTAPDESRN